MTALLPIMVSRGYWSPGALLRLQIGGGGAVQAGHVAVLPLLDGAALLAAELPDDTADEIRIVQYLETLPLGEALAVLIRCQRWLRPGGSLRIDALDPAGMPEGRGATGGHWSRDRSDMVLPRLGFTSVTVCEGTPSDGAPRPSGIAAMALKAPGIAAETVIEAAAACLAAQCEANGPALAPEQWRAVIVGLLTGGRRQLTGSQHPEASVDAMIKGMIARLGDAPPIFAIQAFNQLNRDSWVRARLAEIPAGARVLDVGAGSCPYQADLAHARYESHDFKAYEGYRDPGRGEGLYGRIDHVSDILSLPVADGSFHAVLCTEVLEHVPEPIGAVGEMARVLRRGGLMIVTAPLSSALHQEPYHFYGGYTPHWYRMVAARFGLDVIRLEPNAGFFRHLAQECARVAWTMPKHESLHQDPVAVGMLFGELLPRYLSALDDACMMPEFTVGYHVVLSKR